MTKYGMCDCGKWGIAPLGFRENKHFLKCPVCGKAMYLTMLIGPKELGLSDSNKVEIKEFINHKG